MFIYLDWFHVGLGGNKLGVHLPVLCPLDALKLRSCWSQLFWDSFEVGYLVCFTVESTLVRCGSVHLLLRRLSRCARGVLFAAAFIPLNFSKTLFFAKGLSVSFNSRCTIPLRAQLNQFLICV